VQILHPVITALQHYTQVQGAAQITPEKAGLERLASNLQT
jgi:hypothetical protein